jgi:molecular chaperone HscB
MPAAETARRECWRCHAETAEVLVCPRCAAVQPVAAAIDLFAVLGLPRSPRVDAADLERRYHAASRAVHPDRHQTSGAAERELSLAASTVVNRAYRTLRDPIALGRYWLELHGERLGEGNPKVPPGIAAEVFETQERLEELRAAPIGPTADELRREVTVLRDRLAARLASLREELVAQYGGWNGDGASLLGELKRRLSEIAYLTTLFGDIDEAMGEGLRGTNHRH